MHQEVREAKAFVFQVFPYFSSAISRFSFVFVDDPKVTAFITKDGLIGYGPWFLSLPLPQRAGVLVHETLHFLLGHEGRKGGRNQEKWNVACDLEINDDIAPYLPSDCLLPGKFGFPNHRTAEEYYEKLPEEVQMDSPCGSASGNPHPKEKDISNPRPISQIEKKLLEKKVAEEVKKAIGKVPAFLERWAEKVLQGEVDWRKVLLSMVRGALAHSRLAKLDYTYRRPSRRSRDFLFPSLRAPEPKVAVVIDTSGSISQTELNKFRAEIEGILRLTSATLISCDTVARKVGKNGPWYGGGGTDLGEGIELAKKEKPDVVVILTDGWTPWPQEKPFAATFIVVTTDKEGPSWTKTIKIS